MCESLDESFLESCKAGDTQFMLRNINAVDINYSQGWNLRRAIRYNQAKAWRLLLGHESTLVNLPNRRGLSALHIACRFNIVEAVEDLLKHPLVLVNERTVQGSTPVMVAAKYCSQGAIGVLVKDGRVDLFKKDGQGRHVEDMVGVALGEGEGARQEVVGVLVREKKARRKVSREPSTESIESEVDRIDSLLRQQVIEKIRYFQSRMEQVHGEEVKEEKTIETRWKHPMAELEQFHEQEASKFKEKQEAENGELTDKQRKEMIVFMENQEKEMHKFIENQAKGLEVFKENHEAERAEFKQRQKNEMARLRERQSQETMTVVRAREAERSSVLNNANQMKNGLKKAVSHLCTELNLLETAAPARSLDLVSAARQDLTCPVCGEVMAPPARIWQCEQGHVVCETCKDWLGQLACPTCRTAVITGRNLALERIARSLFDEK